MAVPYDDCGFKVSVLSIARMRVMCVLHVKRMKMDLRRRTLGVVNPQSLLRVRTYVYGMVARRHAALAANRKVSRCIGKRLRIAVVRLARHGRPVVPLPSGDVAHFSQSRPSGVAFAGAARR